MAKKIVLVLGATGTQGGSVAKLLLQFPDQYHVRCLTRTPTSDKAKALSDQGAELCKADLTVPETLSEAFKGAWGVFAVTDFYDTKVLEDPMSEETQGQNIVKAAKEARVECLIWSTLPSSYDISGGKFMTRLYEGKYAVDSMIRDAEIPACFIRTGNFYENMILRRYVSYDREKDVIKISRPIIGPQAEITSLYVEKDLSAVCKAIFDLWDTKKSELKYQNVLAAGARETPGDISAVVERISGKKVEYITRPTTGIKDRDIMLHLYNDVGMYPGVEVPEQQVLALGVKFHSAEDFIRERLLPHLGLQAVA